MLSSLNPNRQYFNKDGWHAIHYAAEKGHANIIGYLVNDCGVSIDLQQDNEYGNTAYQLACRNGHLECIKLLSSLNPNREYFNKTGWHAIHFAVRGGHANIIEYLVNDFDVSIDLQQDNEYGKYSLSAGLSETVPLECIKLLSSLNPNREYFNKTGWHAIHFAAQGGHANIIEYLVNDFDVSIDLQQDNEYGDTAYQLACRNGHLECIKLLSSLNPNRQYFNKNWLACYSLCCREGTR